MGAKYACEKTNKSKKLSPQKWIVIVVAIALVVSVISLSLTQSRAADQLDLSLDQAKELALANNSQIYLANLEVNSAKLASKQADEASNALRRQINQSESQGIPVVLTKEMDLVLKVVPIQAQEALDLYNLTFSYTVDNVQYAVESTYYGLLKAMKSLEIAQTGLDTAKKQYQDAQAKYNNGTISKMELLQVRTNMSSADVKVVEGQNVVDSAMMYFNQLLGLDIYTKINLTSEFKYDDGYVVDYHEAYQTALNTDVSVGAALMNCDLAKLMEDFYQDYRGDNDYDYDQARYDTRKADTNYKQACITLEIQVKEAYNNLLSAQQSYESLLSSLDLAKEAARLAGVQYDNGLVTIDAVNTANDSYMQMQLAVLDSLCNYNLAKVRFIYGVFGSGGASSASSGMSGGQANAAASSAMSGQNQLEGESEGSNSSPNDVGIDSQLSGSATGENSNLNNNVVQNRNSSAPSSGSAPKSSASSEQSGLNEVSNLNNSQVQDELPSDLNPSSPNGSFGTYLPGGEFIPQGSLEMELQ